MGFLIWKKMLAGGVFRGKVSMLGKVIIQQALLFSVSFLVAKFGNWQNGLATGIFFFFFFFFWQLATFNQSRKLVSVSLK